jgi:hypothetical protein
MARDVVEKVARVRSAGRATLVKVVRSMVLVVLVLSCCVVEWLVIERWKCGSER